MNVVDSSGWLEWFIGPAGSGDFSQAIGNTSELLVPSICLYEVHKVLTRHFGSERADTLVFAMTEATVVPLTAEIALLASGLSARHKLATADAMIYATARTYDALLWTQDAHFDGLPGVRFFPKPAAP